MVTDDPEGCSVSREAFETAEVRRHCVTIFAWRARSLLPALLDRVSRILRLMAALSRHQWLLQRYIVSHIRKYPFTLDFCFMGPVAEGLERFCGRAVDWLYTLNTTTSPRSVALQVNLFRGRMNLVMTYISNSMPRTLASTFLDTIIKDLIRE